MLLAGDDFGHSQGGSSALRLAGGEGAQVAGLVLMAAIGRPLDAVILDQVVAHGKKEGLPDDVIAHQVDELRAFVARARSDEPWEAGAVPDRLYLATRDRRWFVEHLALDNSALIAHVVCPILIAQGEADFQVSAEKDARALAAAAQAAGRDVTLITFPGLDHLFKRVSGESTMAQYYDRTRRVDPGFLDELARWIAARS